MKILSGNGVYGALVFVARMVEKVLFGLESISANRSRDTVSIKLENGDFISIEMGLSEDDTSYEFYGADYYIDSRYAYQNGEKLSICSLQTRTGRKNGK